MAERACRQATRTLVDVLAAGLETTAIVRSFTVSLLWPPIVVARPPLVALRYIMYFRFYG